jgi:hypothetical protein
LRWKNVSVLNGLDGVSAKYRIGCRAMKEMECCYYWKVTFFNERKQIDERRLRLVITANWKMKTVVI